MKTLIDVPTEIESRIQELVRRGRCNSFTEFVIRALENQLIAESEDTNPWMSMPTNHLPTSNQKELLDIPRNVRTVESPTEYDLTNQFLWGQYYRFLPMKIGLRVLGNISTKDLTSIDIFAKEAGEVAVGFGYQLKRTDEKRQHGTELSISFPTHEEKSVERYVAQYLVSRRPTDGKLYGMMADLRFANILEQDGEVKVGLTEEGKKFASLVNPIIDGRGFEPLSEEEIHFILSYIQAVLPKEHSALLHMLQSIENGTNTREALNESMENFYRGSILAAKDWSKAHVATMRGGLLSRLVELGFISKEKKGKNVTYLLTETGSKYLVRSGALPHPIG